MIETRNVPKERRKKCLEERLAEIYQKNDIVFMAFSVPLLKGSNEGEGALVLRLNLRKTKQ